MRSRTAGVMTTLMRNGRDRRSENPFWADAILERVLVVGTDQRITSGPAATAAASRQRQSSKRKQAGYMAAPERFADTSDSSCTAGAVHTWPLELHRPRHAHLETEIVQRTAQVVLDGDSPSTAAACDGSAASAASDCVTSSHVPGGKVPPASSAPCRAHHCGPSCSSAPSATLSYVTMRCASA